MLYFETVSPPLLRIARAVSAAPELGVFRLVGGTALSLYLGHRESVETAILDYFAELKRRQNALAAEKDRALRSLIERKKKP